MYACSRGFSFGSDIEDDGQTVGARADKMMQSIELASFEHIQMVVKHLGWLGNLL